MIYIPAVFVFGCPSSQWAYTALIPFRQYKRNPDQLIESQADFTGSIGAHWVGRSCARGCTGGSNGENATASSSALSLSQAEVHGKWRISEAAQKRFTARVGLYKPVARLAQLTPQRRPRKDCMYIKEIETYETSADGSYWHANGVGSCRHSLYFVVPPHKCLGYLHCSVHWARTMAVFPYRSAHSTQIRYGPVNSIGSWCCFNNMLASKRNEKWKCLSKRSSRRIRTTCQNFSIRCRFYDSSEWKSFIKKSTLNNYCY